MKNGLLLRGVLQMALWSLLVEALSATLELPRTVGYWPLAIGVGSMDEEPEPQTMFLKVLGSLSDTEGSAGHWELRAGRRAQVSWLVS